MGSGGPGAGAGEIGSEFGVGGGGRGIVRGERGGGEEGRREGK